MDFIDSLLLCFDILFWSGKVKDLKQEEGKRDKASLSYALFQRCFLVAPDGIV